MNSLMLHIQTFLTQILHIHFRLLKICMFTLVLIAGYIIFKELLRFIISVAINIKSFTLRRLSPLLISYDLPTTRAYLSNRWATNCCLPNNYTDKKYGVQVYMVRVGSKLVGYDT